MVLIRHYLLAVVENGIASMGEPDNGSYIGEKVGRYFDEKSGLWYSIYWNDALKCYVTELENGQHSLLPTIKED